MYIYLFLGLINLCEYSFGEQAVGIHVVAIKLPGQGIHFKLPELVSSPPDWDTHVGLHDVCTCTYMYMHMSLGHNHKSQAD